MMARPNMKPWDSANMAAKPVQISLDAKLLARVDRDPETKRRGRSAFIRAAIERYLADKDRQAIDAKIREAYSDPKAVQEDLELVREWEEVQAWPEED
jgi:metal-responsive CopG/Arc/MetJ family transcriptional regulator